VEPTFASTGHESTIPTMKSAAPPSRFRRNLWIVAVLLSLFTIIGFVVLPPILETQLEKRLSAELGRTVTVGKVRFNPYALSLTLENFDIRMKEGKESFLGWSRLYVDFDIWASLTGDWVLDEIELDGFHAAPEIQADGSLNFSDILAKLDARPKPPEPPKPGRPLRVGSLKVRQARVDFGDLSRKSPFKSKIGPLTFALTGFRTVGSRGAPYHLEAVTEAGEKLAWSGTLSADPLASHGDFQIADLILKKYTPYVEEKIQSDLTDGKLGMKGSYEISLGGQQRVMKLANGEVHLRDLKVVERASHESALELAALDVMGVQADAIAMKATVGSVALMGGKIAARREKDGSINLVTMMQPEKTAAKATPASAASPGTAPDVSVADITLKDFQIDLSDLAAPRPVQLGLTGIQLSLKEATLADGAAMPLELSLGLASQGTVHVAGTVSIKPTVRADLKTEVNGLELLPFSPYLEQFVNARLTQGSLTVGMEVKAEMPSGQPLAATAAGEVKLEKFALVDGAKNEELAGVGTMLLKGLKIATAPQLSIGLDEVNIAGPYARVIVAKDRSLNLATLARAEEKPAGETNAAIAEKPSAPPKIEIGRVVLSEGDFSFADLSVEPNVRTAIKQFAGTVTGLSSENLAKAGVDLKATVDGAGPVAITGQLDPLGTKKFVDLKIDFKNVDLLPLSPYSGKYAGYELARGKLMLDVKFRLDDKKIDASDVITLNQFTFGTATNSPDATGLPVRLGVALLKDTDGKIVIDVPIQGNTDDPNFRIGRVVLRVVVNLLTKAAVSPFSLLGSMFGGGGEELAYQEFSPGASTLQPAEIKKLETMVKALTNRPGLSVALEGSYDGPADTFELKRQKLAETVRRAIWDQKHAVSPAIPPPELLAISPEENAAMVKQLFDAKFPTGTQFDAALAKAPEAAAPPPPAKKGIFKKVVDVVTLKKLRGEKSKEKKAAAPVETKSPEGAISTGPSLEEMSGRLAEAMEVGDNDLRALAAARAQQVRDYFINVGKVDPERLFLAKGPVDPTKTAKGSRVFLSLQ
jgi:Domain of Unknown Function (DUF748)